MAANTFDILKSQNGGKCVSFSSGTFINKTVIAA